MTNTDDKPTEKKTVKLTLNEVIQLNGELKALNKEKEISFVIKYKLIKLFERTARLIKNFETTRVEIFQQYGKEMKDKPGNFTLQEATAKNKAKATEELIKLTEVEEEFTGYEMKLADFAAMKTENAYEIIFRFINE